LNSIPAAQRKRLSDLLTAATNRGEVSSAINYEAKLAQELAELESKLGKPQFKLRNAPYRSITNSANLNDMENKAIAALKILYTELASLLSGIDNYSLLSASRLQAVEDAITRLEHTIDTLEILATNSEGYLESIAYSFSEENTKRLLRDDAPSLAPFTLDDLGYLPPTEDAVADNGQLRLPIASSLDYLIGGAQVTNQNPTGPSSEVSEDIPTEEAQYALAKLIDNNADTYWAETVQVSDLSVNYAQCDLVLALAGVQQVNRIIIDPFSRFPYKITSITYKRNRNSETSYDVEIDLPILISKRTVIEFAGIYADTIILHLEQTNFSQLRYITQGSMGTIERIIDLANGQDVDVSDLTDPNNIYFAMSVNMRNKLGLTTTQSSDAKVVDVYEFMYGIKTIALNQLKYGQKGIFVSEPGLIELAGAAGLESDEAIDLEGLNSIEYDLLVDHMDYDDNDELQLEDRRVYNILPSDAEGVTGEVLDGKEDTVAGTWTATTRFPVDLSSADLVIKQNNVAMSVGFYSVSYDTNNYATITITNSQIASRNRAASFFTADYTPTESAWAVDFPRHDAVSISLRILLRSLDATKLSTPRIASYSMKFKRFTES